MTTPPEARLYRISREESVLARSTSGGTAANMVGGAAGTARAANLGQRANPAGPAVRVEVRKKNPTPSGAPPAGDANPVNPAPSGAVGKGRDAAAGTDPAKDRDDLAAAVGAVKAERLSPRQLRVAQRIARSHGIVSESDEEAVAKLRMMGIDPLHRSGLRKVVAEEGERATAEPSPASSSLVSTASQPTRLARPLPATAPGSVPATIPDRPLVKGKPAQLPSREAMTEQRRAAEILKIQRDIARRRRRRMALLFARLAAFVILPTILAGWYYFKVATPLYSTESQFQIQKAEGAGMSAGGLGGLLAGTSLATNTDSVAVQSYLGSRDAMLRLDQDLGFKRVFQDPSIDPLLRLPPDATNDAAYSIYRNVVKVSYDPTEGVIGLEVQAPDPKLSQNYSLALIRYAEGQVDQMTARIRDDQMIGAQETYADAEKKVDDAQRRIQEIQQKLGVLDPISENASAMSQITTLENELTKKQLELGALQANARPNSSRVQGVQGDVDRLTQMIADRRASLTQNSGSRDSLAAVTGELRIAEGDLVTRQQLLAASAAQVETARIEANKQVRYLSLAVAPVPPDTPSYPKSWQNTLIAFLIFAGIYLMLSLTASILREQVSS